MDVLFTEWLVEKFNKRSIFNKSDNFYLSKFEEKLFVILTLPNVNGIALPLTCIFKLFFANKS